MSEPKDTPDTPGPPVPDETPATRQGHRSPTGPADAVVEDVAYTIPAGRFVDSSALLPRLGAEAFGTFLLVIAGLGVALYSGFTGLGGGPLAVGLAFGLAYVAGAVALGHVSGAHFNPAVTLGAAIAGRSPWRDVVPYWLAQLIGGAFAAAVLFVALASFPALDGAEKTFFSTTANGFGDHSPIGAVSGAGGSGFSLWGALIIEAVLTATFVGVVLGSTDRRSTKAHAPFSIGLVYTVLLLAAIPVTNGSLNPARSTAAAIFSEGWAFGQLWLFWVAPLVGAAVAALVYRAFVPEPVEDNLQQEDDVEEVDVIEEVDVVDGPEEPKA
ncbi:aquaporin [Cellulomonas sp. P22]|uniref:aquaporin n=1 Tax=Cellulomonas sp. P22 TaxID=3373189 RepID=UPI00379C6902